MRNSSDKQPSPNLLAKAHNAGRYAVVPLELITDGSITHAEFRLLCFLRAHDLPDRTVGGQGKGFVTVSHSTIAKALGIADVKGIGKALRTLERKGFVRREIRPGRLGKIHLTWTPGAEHPRSPAPPAVNTDGVQCPSTPGAEHPLKNRMEEEKLRVPSGSHPNDAQQPVFKPVGASKARTRRKENDPLIRLVLDHFHDEHISVIGEKPHIIGGRDSAAIKRLLATFPEDELRVRITRYLEDPLTWMDKPQHTLPGFEKRVNAYSNGNAVDDTADTSWDKEF